MFLLETRLPVASVFSGPNQAPETNPFSPAILWDKKAFPAQILVWQFGKNNKFRLFGPFFYHTNRKTGTFPP